MGEFYVVLADLDLGSAGSKPIKKSFKVTGELREPGGKIKQATGEVELAFSIMN